MSWGQRKESGWGKGCDNKFFYEKKIKILIILVSIEIEIKIKKIIF